MSNMSLSSSEQSKISVRDLQISMSLDTREMISSQSQGPEDQNLLKTACVCSEEGRVHNHGIVDTSTLIGNEHNVLSLENSGLYIPEVWFSNSIGPDQTAALPIIIGGSSILEDEIWSDFLFQTQSNVEDVETRAEPDSLLEDAQLRNTGPKEWSGLSEVLAEMHTAQQNSEMRRNLDSQLSQQEASPEKTKAVHWPDESNGEKTLKRQRSVRQSPPSILIMDSPILSEGPVIESILTNSGDVMEREIRTGVASPNFKFDSQSPTSEGMDIAVAQARIDVPVTSSSEATRINDLDSPRSEMSKGQSRHGDISGGDLSMPANRTVAQAPGGTPFNEIRGKDQDGSANSVSPGRLLPVGPVKSAVATKPHHVQLVERNMGGRIISTAGTFGDPSLPRENRWAEQLLLDCATAISSNNFVRTQHLMWVLNDLGSLTGDANQRLAAHGLKSLFCKLTGTGEAVAGSNPGQVNLGPKSVHRALLKFHDVNPWHHMVYTLANSVMIDSFEGENKVHVIDIGVSQGTQWPTFIEALATRASGPPVLRLTMVKDEEKSGTGMPQGPTSTDFMAQLERFAKLMGISIELHTVVTSLETLTRDKLNLKAGEALAICAQFRLHRLPETVEKEELVEGGREESVKYPFSARDTFLHFMHELQPKVVILSENDTDHLATDFLTRFGQAVDYLWKFLDSTSFSFHGKHSQERQIIEHEAAMAMINNVACEGAQRIERNELHIGWVTRMERARFVPVLPREEILENITTLVRKYDANWEYCRDMECVVLLWKQQPVTFCSVWKPI